jgi:TolB-like protein/class 3 adenylate cyclase/Tfp pilus assembly protein PilF
MERKLAAILAADVAGYSRLMGADEEGTLNALRAHREVVDGLIVAHRGRVFGSAGDSVVAEFPSAVEAVNCAVEIQQEIEERNEAVAKDKRLAFRIGLNIGDVMAEGGNLFGDGVNVAARLQEVAEPGGICAAHNVHDQVHHKVGVGFEYLGPHHVKNIAEPVAVYRVLAAGAAAQPRLHAWFRQAWRRTVPLGALALVLPVVAGALVWDFHFREPATSLPLPDKPSIAVLPFDSLGDDKKWDRFADGVTEDIITDLSHSKDLFVIARNSTAVYKGKSVDIRQVGRDLGVKYVLEGSIQPAGDRVRATAQLVEAATGTHVWSERYDRPADDLFAVQQDVTEKIAATLAGYQGAIAGAERRMIRRKSPTNLTAFDYYLLAMEAKHTVTKEGFLEAEQLFNKAIELDPHLARAYVGLVLAYGYILDLGLSPSVPDTLNRQMAVAQRAVAIDPDDGETHLALGVAYAYSGDPPKATSELDRAESLAPHNADLLMIAAWILPSLGKPERAAEFAERAIRLNPRYPYWYNQPLRWVYFVSRNFESSLEAARQIQEPLALDYAFLAMIHGYLDHEGDAKSAAAETLRLDPEWSIERYLSETGGFARDEETNLMIEGARKSGIPVCAVSQYVTAHPDLKRLAICEQERAKS